MSEFSHRFVNTQHQLDRLIPGIHRTPSGEETKLLYAYTIKLKPEIQKELVSRDFGKFKKLSQLIETAERYELCLQTENRSNSLENWSQSGFSAVLDNDNKQKVITCHYCKESGHFKYNCPKLNRTNDPKPVYNAHQTVVICRDFNNQAHSNCEKPMNKCSKGRLCL